MRKHLPKWFTRLSLWLIISSCGFLSNYIFCQETKPVYILPIKGVIDLGLSGFVKRVVKEAKKDNASSVIVEIDTFGGRVDAAGEIVKSLEELKPIPTKAIISGEAWSAGALLSLACEEIYMTPGSSIGSAEPRAIGMGSTEEATDEKTISALRAKFKATAEANRHNPKLAEAFVDKDVELKLVRINEKNFILTPEEIEERNKAGEEIKVIKTITEKGKLLNLTAEEAKEIGLAKEIVANREELLNLLNLKENMLIEPTPTWSENLVRFITHPIVSSLLLTLGFLGIIFEIKIPGWGIAGTLGAISLALFFWGHYLVGLANWTEIILFILALILIFLEIFVIPGFGIAGISGGILLLASIFLALLKHPLHAPRIELIQAFQVVVYSFFVTLAVLLVSINFIPRTGLWKKIILQQKETKEEGYTAIDLTKENLIGKIGKTITTLRPAGKADFSGKIMDVVSEGEFIDRNKEIKVVSVEGNKIVVKAV
ncbi:MAG: nodulation protein NfeD [Candidatus Omnitrophota bacterium]